MAPLCQGQETPWIQITFYIFFLRDVIFRVWDIGSLLRAHNICERCGFVEVFVRLDNICDHRRCQWDIRCYYLDRRLLVPRLQLGHCQTIFTSFGHMTSERVTVVVWLALWQLHCTLFDVTTPTNRARDGMKVTVDDFSLSVVGGSSKRRLGAKSAI